MAVITKIIANDNVGRTAQITSTTSGTTIYTVTSGRKFTVKSLIITNPVSGEIATVSFYDADVSTSNPPLPPIMLDTGTISFSENELHGVTFISSVVAWSDTSGVWVHIGGFEE